MPSDEPPILVVLGAPNDEHGRLLAVARGRAETALREYRANPRTRLILTGGFGAHFNVTERPHFDHVARYLTGHGVAESAIIGRLATTHTAEDAEQTAAFVAERGPGSPIRVVTSDFHLARARLLFERSLGPRADLLEMVPAPARLSTPELCAALRHEAESLERFG
jgi:uncharacterized SAM-binding protein YcdF (DUF218 family)